VRKILATISLLLLSTVPINKLVNIDNPLPTDYSPGENTEARESVENFISNLQENTVDEIIVTSGYRSYNSQKTIHAYWCSNFPFSCEKFSAQAGTSEHQLGTTFDLSRSGYYMWDTRNKSLWEMVEVRAHLYGFVISYPYKECPEDGWPKNNAYEAFCGTDFKYEPWHLRYVGTDLATKIFEAGYLDPNSKVLPKDFFVR